jgi:hypothetical protein
MKQIFSQPIIAMFSAARLLFKNRRALALMLAAYTGLLTAIFLFVSTREATIPQLILTMVVAIAAPALFFVLQTVSVSYTNGSPSSGLIKNSLKLIVVSVPVIALTVLAVYGLSKVNSYVTLVTATGYLLASVVAPLLAIQLWIAASSGELRGLLKGLRRVAARAFAPQSVFVYVCGFLIFAVAPYLLITLTVPAANAWLEFMLLMLRLSVSGLLIVFGWVMTVGALSILNRANQESTS